MYVSRVIRVPFGSAALPRGTDSTEVSIRFREAGWVTGLAVSAGDTDSPAARMSLALKLILDGGRSIFLDGERASTFALFDIISPIVGPGRNCTGLPLVVPVNVGERWRFTARNRSTTADYIPQASLAFITQADLAAAMQRLGSAQPIGIPRPSPAFAPALPPITRVSVLDVPSIAPGQTSNYQLCEYPERCNVLGVRASPVESSLSRQDMSFEIYDTDCKQNITSDGDSSDFVPVDLAAIGTDMVLPIFAAKNEKDHHRVRVQNLSLVDTFASQVAFLFDGSLRGGT